MIGRIKDGGLSMPDFDIIDKSLRAGWVKRLLNLSSAILEDIRAVYTRENRPRLTIAAAYIRREHPV